MGDDDDCCSFMELLSCEGVVPFDRRPIDSNNQEAMIEMGYDDGFLFSPPPPPPPSCSSSSSSACGFSQMLSFGSPNEERFPFNNNSPNRRSRAKSTKILEANGGGRSTVATTNATRKPTAGSAGTVKVRKEKLGDRISALQQLVSPFGKTDTATVLLEAIGYIKFLHDQVQVLSSPYLSSHQHEEQRREFARGDLGSRGLCLVPVSCTENVASNSNIGADLWSPAAVGGSSSSSSGSKH
ncbi:transcription factor bHLH113-like [Asparagus officinalis]|uniref:transcription factor bHLH113-like n=1 Tax=Asparagus officinalis TaxID=4686 RepID=UPI00098E62BB|nr:transcription factor bHLH113-like [Asparagus officinalis]